MSAKTFIDTNILIYAHDVDASTKHSVAKRVLQRRVRQGKSCWVKFRRLMVKRIRQ